jgi:hypothetical protein
MRFRVPRGSRSIRSLGGLTRDEAAAGGLLQKPLASIALPL